MALWPPLLGRYSLVLLDHLGWHLCGAPLQAGQVVLPNIFDMAVGCLVSVESAGLMTLFGELGEPSPM